MNRFISCQHNRKAIFILVLSALVIFLTIRPAIDPKAASIFSKLQHTEYTGIEQSTWIFSSLAAIFALLSAIILKKRESRCKSWMIAAAIFALFALEEISWGGRFLRFPYPQIFGDFVDGVHDVPFLIRRTVFCRFFFYQKLIFASLAVAAIALLLLWKKDMTKKFFARVSNSLPAKMIFVGSAFLVIAQIIDIQVIPNHIWARAWFSFLPPTYVEESAECLASICFLLAGIEKVIKLNLIASAESVLVTEKESIVERSTSRTTH